MAIDVCLVVCVVVGGGWPAKEMRVGVGWTAMGEEIVTGVVFIVCVSVVLYFVGSVLLCVLERWLVGNRRLGVVRSAVCDDDERVLNSSPYLGSKAKAVVSPSQVNNLLQAMTSHTTIWGYTANKSSHPGEQREPPSIYLINLPHLKPPTPPDRRKPPETHVAYKEPRPTCPNAEPPLEDVS